jgi:MYXO-CTERM domain-containing protein
LLVVGNQLGTPELLLALASLLTIGALQRRRSRLFAAVGLTIAALAVGLLIGSLISAGSSLPIGEAQFAAIPTLLLLAATAVLFD